jgi:electron transfer flavoprotein beta subunit
LKIVVTVKLVPDTNAEKRIDATTKRLVRGGDLVLNPFDEYALEAALQIREARNDGTTVTVLTMAPAGSQEPLRKALAMGADDVLVVSDERLVGSDVPGTAAVLAAALRKHEYDLVICGTQSTDAITGELSGMLAEYLGVPGLTYARKLALDGMTLTAERETDSGYLEVAVELPALVSVTKSINEPRYPSLRGIMGAKKKTISSLSLADLGVTQAVGQDGAKTALLALDSPPPRAKGRVVQAQDPAAAAAAVFELLKEKKLV